MEIFKSAYTIIPEEEIVALFLDKNNIFHKSDLASYYVSPRNASRGANKYKHTYCNKMIYDAVRIFCNYLFLKRYKSEVYFINNFVYGTIYFENEVKEYFDGLDSFSFSLEIDPYLKNIKLILSNNLQDRFDDVKLYTLYFLCIFHHFALKIQYEIEYHKYLLEYLRKKDILNYVRVCEEFYQEYKTGNFEISYSDLSYLDDLSHSKEVHVMSALENELDLSNYSLKNEISSFNNEDFKEEYLSRIPRLGSEIIMPNEIENICSAIKEGDCISYLQYGPSGTGKTMNVKLICSKINLPLMDVINCSDSLDELVLGKFVPSEGDGKIVFLESMFTKAIRYGGAVVLEEINFGRPQYLSFLNSLLDDNGLVRLDNGEEVKRHPNFRLFATMNFNYLGTNELNQALYNRFNVIQEIKELSKDKIESMLLARAPHSKPYLDQVYQVYERIKQEIKEKELEYIISPRTLEMWCRMAKYSSFISASEYTLVSIAKEDEAFKDIIRTIVSQYKW